jgi:hypothetical protein
MMEDIELPQYVQEQVQPKVTVSELVSLANRGKLDEAREILKSEGVDNSYLTWAEETRERVIYGPFLKLAGYIFEAAATAPPENIPPPVETGAEIIPITHASTAQNRGQL